MAAAQRAGEHEHAPVWRPRRPFVFPTIGDDALARSVRTHHADPKRSRRLLGEGNEVAARTPDRRSVLAAAKADAMYVRTICIHDVHLLRSAAVRFENDL